MRDSSLNRNDLSGMEVARGICRVENDPATQDVDSDYSRSFMFRDGLTRAHAHEHHTISGLVDKYFGVDSGVVIFDQTAEIELLHPVSCSTNSEGRFTRNTRPHRRKAL